MVDNPHVWVGDGELVGELGRAVGRAVVDDDQLVVGDVAAFDQVVAGPAGEGDGALDVVLLVPHREEHRQLLERCAGGVLRRLVAHRMARVAAEAADQHPPTVRPVTATDGSPDDATVVDAPAAPVPPPPPPMSMPFRRPLQAGHQTMGWRVVTACTWVLVIVAFAGIWNTSVQLGLSTWWLGPRGDPQPQAVRLLPFIAPVLMCLAVFNNLRHLAYLGLGAAAVVAVFGLGDLGRVPELAVLELLIAAMAAGVSFASLTGTYRPATNTGLGARRCRG